MKPKDLTIAIVAGAPVAKKFLPLIKRNKVLIGVDRGALFLIQNKIVPDVALGDFDSVTARERTRIQKHAKTFIPYPKKKDATDLELAVRHASGLAPREVVIYGALGKRFDHAIAATHVLLALHARGIAGSMYDAQNEVRIITGTHRIETKKGYRYVSIVPVTKSAIVTLRGFVYDLKHKTLRRGSTLGVSNEAKRFPADITIHAGVALLIFSRDEAGK